MKNWKNSDNDLKKIDRAMYEQVGIINEETEILKEPNADKYKNEMKN